MKLKFSLLLLLLSYNSMARDVVIYTYDFKDEMFEKVMKMVLDENAVKSEDFKFIKKENPCEDIYKDALLHICISEKNEGFKVVRQNKRALNNTFSK